MMNTHPVGGFPRGLRSWVMLFGLCNLIGLINATTFWAQYRLDNEAVPIRKILVNELTGAYTFFVLLPLLLLFMGRVRIHRENWFWSVPAHLLASMIFGGLQTTLMTLSRSWFYPLCDLHRYDPGNPYFRYLMEYSKQLLIYVMVLVIFYTFIRISAARIRERQAAELTLQASRLQEQFTDARLRVLQGQLQPHFLFNTLNMISSFMYEDVGRADRMLTRLSSLLRLSLDTSERHLVPLWQEMELLSLYLEIMTARFGDRLQVQLDLDPALGERPVPTLILQPLVENAVRHGEPEPGHPARITVAARGRGDWLMLTVTDNGPGVADPAAATAGMGLRSVRERLDQLYQGRARFRLTNLTPQGFQVEIELPPDTGEVGLVGGPAAAMADVGAPGGGT